jgi:hypothetical protein
MLTSLLRGETLMELLEDDAVDGGRTDYLTIAPLSFADRCFLVGLSVLAFLAVVATILAAVSLSGSQP